MLKDVIGPLGGGTRFENLPRGASELVPAALEAWIRINSGPFRFSYKLAINKECIYGGLEINPVKFSDYRDSCREWANETWIADDREELRKWMVAFPFAELANGDFLAFECKTKKDAPIIYLAHDNGSEVIAPLFQDFLRNWIALCCIGPEIWMLNPYRDPLTGYLDSTSPAGATLRGLFGID